MRLLEGESLAIADGDDRSVMGLFQAKPLVRNALGGAHADLAALGVDLGKGGDLPAFSAEWTLQLVVVFVVLGFPVVMVLAWVFDITTDGIRVTAALEHEVVDLPSTGTLPRLALMTVTLPAVGGVGSWWILNTVQGTDAVTTALGPSVFPAAYDPDEGPDLLPVR